MTKQAKATAPTKTVYIVKLKASPICAESDSVLISAHLTYQSAKESAHKALRDHLESAWPKDEHTYSNYTPNQSMAVIIDQTWSVSVEIDLVETDCLICGLHLIN